MIRVTEVNPGFSLIELTLSLGLTAFCLIAVLGLVPVGIATNRDAISHTATASILSSLITDLRATPRADSRSPQYGITFGTAQSIYLNADGRLAMPTDFNITPYYKVTIAFPVTGTTLPASTFISLKVSWPAFANSESNPSVKSVDYFVAVDRN